MVRASWVLNRQLMVARAALRSPTRAWTSRLQGFLVGESLLEAGTGQDAELNLGHPFDKLRTGFSQLPCLGV